VTFEIFPDDDDARGTFRKAVELRAQGEWREALGLLVLLLRGRLRKPKSLSVSERILVEEIAALAVVCGINTGVDQLLTGLIEENRRSGDTFAADFLTVSLANQRLDQGRLHAALECLESLRDRMGPLTDVPYEADQLPPWELRIDWPGKSHVDRALFFAHLYRTMGRWLSAHGRYGHSAVLLARGAFHAGPSASREAQQAWVPLTLDLANVRIEQGEVPAAQAIVRGVVGRIDPLADPGWHIQYLESVAQVHLLCGRYGDAVQGLAQVTAFCLERGLPRAAMNALINQAEVFVVLNDVAVAEDLLADAKDLAEKLSDPKAKLRIQVLQRLAAARGRPSAFTYDEALTVMEMQRGPSSADAPHGKSVVQIDQQLREQQVSFFGLFNDRVLEVQWSLADGDVENAGKRFEQIQPVFADCESPLIRLRLHALAAQVAYAKRNYAEADRICDRITPHFEERGLSPDVCQSLRMRVWCSGRLHSGGDQQAALTQRTDYVLSKLVASLSPADRVVYLLNKWTIEERRLVSPIQQLVIERQQLASASRATRLFRWWNWAKKLHTYLHQLDDHRRQLAARELHAPGLAATVNSLWSRLWKHPRRLATVSFLVLPDRVVVVRAGWMDLELVVRPIPRIWIREEVRAWHQLAAPGDGVNQVPAGKLDEIAKRLPQVLGLDEILDKLPRRISTLTVVPDDVLTGFPFAAMRLKNGEYLVERFAFNVRFDRSLVPIRERGPLQTALTVAVSRGPEPPLPNSLVEAADVDEWLSRHNVKPLRLADNTADRDAVMRALSRHELVHVACHGRFVPDRPGDSGLVMMPARGRIELLSLRDLAHLQLQGVKHITLSSCWLADNFVLPGRWIISLPETLLRRGVHSVLACRWPIEDGFARAFSRRFYENLETTTRVDALRQAQVSAIRNELIPECNTAHPFWWAGYVLIGEPGRLRMASQAEYRPSSHAQPLLSKDSPSPG
jgi:CHAT domain